MSAKIVSLQKKIVANAILSSAIAGFVALILLFALSTFQVMQTQDEIMEQISDMLLSHDITQTNSKSIDELAEEFEVEYQLSLNDIQLTHSEDFRLNPKQHTYSRALSGYQYDWYDQTLWRTYYQMDEDGELAAYLLQPLSYRFIYIMQTLLIYALVLLVLLLLQWKIASVFIKKQMYHLHLLSGDIAAKKVADFTPFKSDDYPIQELQPVVEQTNKMLARLQQSLLAEQRFTADASHELRSPLSAIQMRLQVLARKYQDDASLKLAMSQIQNDVQRGTNILENLLLLARLDPQDRQQLPLEQTDIQQVILTAITAVEAQAQLKNIQWKLQLKPIFTQLNSDLMVGCFINLLDNAIRYHHQNGTIFISCIQHNNTLDIVIEDDGTQLSEEALKHLGERFYRALGTNTQGTGLGLSICKKIILLHGGQILFLRSHLKGLKVMINLPITI